MEMEIHNRFPGSLCLPCYLQRKAKKAHTRQKKTLKLQMTRRLTFRLSQQKINNSIKIRRLLSTDIDIHGREKDRSILADRTLDKDVLDQKFHFLFFLYM